MNFKTLYTERFNLKVLTPELVGKEYLSWFNSKESSQYIDFAKTQITLESLKNYVQEKYESPEALMFGIFTRDNIHVGNIKFEPVNFNKHFCVLGIMIGNVDFQGKGVFSEIMQVLEIELSKLGIKKIHLGVDKNNFNAIKAYEKNNFVIDSFNSLNHDLSKYISMVRSLGET